MVEKRAKIFKLQPPITGSAVSLPLVSTLPWREPYAAAQLLARHRGCDGLVLLDTYLPAESGISQRQQEGTSRWSFLGTAPIRQLCCQSWPSWEHGAPSHADDPFTLLRRAMPERGTWPPSTEPPFMGGWMGWLSYEAGAWLERHPPWQRPDQPLLWAGLHDPLLCFDLLQQQVLAISHGFTGEGWERSSALAVERQETLLKLWTAPTLPSPEHSEPLQGAWLWHTSAAEFAQQVGQIKERIGAGDIFQANLSCCCEAILPNSPDPLQLYGYLRQRSPAPFAGLVICGEHALLSASPERFLHVGADGWVEARPIKGTRARHQHQAQDAAMAVELLTSSKDRAENIMIVDLLRNDLGRVCRPGTIAVPTLVGLESYQQVHHLTSVVTGQLRDHHDALDLLRNAWPGGSITGAPKVRSCQRLAELEPLPRGPYCGSLFWLGLDGSLDSNIIIRSVIRKGRRLRAHAGCGIVYDSDPAAETREMHLKMAPLLQLLQPIP